MAIVGLQPAGRSGACTGDNVHMIPCETYSRVSGYFRPVNQWNAGKRSEFNERKYVNANHITDNAR